jgi:DNA-binding MarR family transcriptional regulator
MPLGEELSRQEPTADPVSAAGMLAREHIAVLLSNIGSRLTRGATAYYRAAWNIGMVEWRLLMVLSSIQSLNVSELSDAADVDKAAASRSLMFLQERKLVSVEQTRSRGRAAIAKLTGEGRKLAAKLYVISREREARLLQDLSRSDREHLYSLLRTLSGTMDAEGY